MANVSNKNTATETATETAETAPKAPEAKSKKSEIRLAVETWKESDAKIAAAQKALDEARRESSAKLGTVVSLLGGRRKFSVDGEIVNVRHSSKRGFYVREDSEQDVVEV